MVPTIVYIYPAADGDSHTELAIRFLDTYRRFPPGADHESVVVVNGARTSPQIRCLFGSLPNLRFLEHDDSGWDIGGYQAASNAYPSEMMVFFGGSTYFKRNGWLARMKHAFEKHGEAIYGATVNRGIPHVKVYPHVRTTGFWMSSALFNKYPLRIRKQEQRYPFEHGKNCLTEWVRRRGLKAWLVTWFEELLWEQWDVPYRDLYHGAQSALLVADRLTDSKMR